MAGTRKKVYTDKLEFDRANQAYNDSLKYSQRGLEPDMDFYIDTAKTNRINRLGADFYTFPITKKLKQFYIDNGVTNPSPSLFRLNGNFYTEDEVKALRNKGGLDENEDYSGNPRYIKPTTEPVYKELKSFQNSPYFQKYTAAKALQLQNKPSGYVNEGNKQGRVELKTEGGWLDKFEDGGLLNEPTEPQILPKDSVQYNNAYNAPSNQGRVGFTTEKDYLNNWFSSQRFKNKIGTADPNSVSNEAVNKVKTSKLFYNPNDTKSSIENYVDMHTNTSKRDKKELLKHKAVGKSYKDSNDAIITKVEGQNNPNSISIHELTHLTGLDELNRNKFKGTLYQNKYGNTVPFNRGEAYPSLMQFRYDNNFKPDQVITPEDMINIRNKGYRNILDNKYTDDEILNYLNTVADNSKANPNQMAKGGLLKRADGSYSRPGLWDNIRANKGSGKAPTKQMLEQERKIKNKYEEGGEVDTAVQDNTAVKVQKPNYKIATTPQEIFLHDRNKRLKELADNPQSYNVKNDYIKLGINEPGLEKPVIDPIDLVGTGVYKGLAKALGAKEVVQGAKGLVSDAVKYAEKKSVKPITPSSTNVQQAGFINTKGAFQKYPKGKLTQEEIDTFKNSDFYKQVEKEHLELKNKYGDNWTLPNYAETSLQEAIATGNRSKINPILYGGKNWSAADYILAGVIGTAYPGVASLYGLVAAPPAVRSKVLKNIGIQGVPGGLSSRDTIIDLTNRNMDFAKVNQTKDGQVILGGEFIEDINNTVRKSKDWLTATDTYSDKEYPSKDVQSFYGVENGKFKVGKASDFNPETEIVPRRFGAININKAVMNNKEMRLLDKDGNPIYQNTPNTGKFILYSPSTGKTQFTYINTGKSGVDKVNNFLKKNKDAQYIHLDNGRYEYYGINPEGLTEQDFKNYYEQDLKREGNPGYNLILKSNGGWLDNLK